MVLKENCNLSCDHLTPCARVASNAPEIENSGCSKRFKNLLGISSRPDCSCHLREHSMVVNIVSTWKFREKPFFLGFLSAPLPKIHPISFKERDCFFFCFFFYLYVICSLLCCSVAGDVDVKWLVIASRAGKTKEFYPTWEAALSRIVRKLACIANVPVRGAFAQSGRAQIGTREKTQRRREWLIMCSHSNLQAGRMRKTASYWNCLLRWL